MEIFCDFFKILGLNALILFIVYVIVLVLIFLDLWSGIRKAKANDEFISSTGYRKTMSKIASYFNVLFAVTAIDVLQMLAIFELKYHGSMTFIPILPLLTFLAAIFIGFIEIKSIYENAEQKQKVKAEETAKIVREILKNKDAKDIITGVINQIRTDDNK